MSRRRFLVLVILVLVRIFVVEVVDGRHSVDDDGDDEVSAVVVDGNEEEELTLSALRERVRVDIIVVIVNFFVVLENVREK